MRAPKLKPTAIARTARAVVTRALDQEPPPARPEWIVTDPDGGQERGIYSATQARERAAQTGGSARLA